MSNICTCIRPLCPAHRRFINQNAAACIQGPFWGSCTAAPEVVANVGSRPFASFDNKGGEPPFAASAKAAAFYNGQSLTSRCAENMSSRYYDDKIFSKSCKSITIVVPMASILRGIVRRSKSPNTGNSMPREGAILADNDPRMAAT